MTEQDVDIPGYVSWAWGGGHDGRPGPKRSLDPATIGAAGVRVADEHGVDAVSMRSVATELGVSSMALYRYVESKRELLLLVADTAYGPPPKITAGRREWRAQLHDWAVAIRDQLIRHPWVVLIPPGEPPLLPNSIRWLERALAALARTSLTAQQRLSCVLLIDVFVRGQIALFAGLDPAAVAADADRLYTRRLTALAAPERFPHLHEVLAAGALEDDSELDVDEFDFGLETVLDGIAALVERTR